MAILALTRIKEAHRLASDLRFNGTAGKLRVLRKQLDNYKYLSESEKRAKQGWALRSLELTENTFKKEVSETSPVQNRLRHIMKCCDASVGLISTFTVGSMLFLQNGINSAADVARLGIALVTINVANIMLFNMARKPPFADQVDFIGKAIRDLRTDISKDDPSRYL
jgi:hypothetical protein